MLGNSEADAAPSVGASNAIRARGRWWWARVALAGVGVWPCAWAVLELAASGRAILAVGSANPQRRAWGLADAADRRDRRALDAVMAVLAGETDRALLEKAGYAAMRIADRRALPVLLRRAEEPPDDETRARLILYAARLSQRDPRLLDRLTRGAAGGEPWRRAGAMLGLIELGQPAGGRMLIESLPVMDGAVRTFALEEFRGRPGAAMLEAVGAPMDWSGLAETSAADPRWQSLREFWNTRATARLLDDVLTRLDRRDPDWFLVGRLLHAREKFARLLFGAR